MLQATWWVPSEREGKKIWEKQEISNNSFCSVLIMQNYNFFMFASTLSSTWKTVTFSHERSTKSCRFKWVEISGKYAHFNNLEKNIPAIAEVKFLFYEKQSYPVSQFKNTRQTFSFDNQIFQSVAKVDFIRCPCLYKGSPKEVLNSVISFDWFWLVSP